MAPPALRMPKAERCREHLHRLSQWDDFLLAESGLPGPRANLELAQTVADLGDPALFRRYLSLKPAQAPANSAQVFLVICGVIGYERLLADGQTSALGTLRTCAGDSRWRVREGVALALQRVGAKDMRTLLRYMRDWSHGTLLEQRAVAAALAEPRLLRDAKVAKAVLGVLRQITRGIVALRDRTGPDFLTLRQTLGYAWSVAVAALPVEGKRQIERWITTSDKDVIWIMKENLTKKRLTQLGPEWVARCQRKLATRSSDARRRR